MAVNTSRTVWDPKSASRAAEDLRSTHSALVMAACGIAADLRERDDGGVYNLLMAVAEKLDRHVITLETLVGIRNE